MLLRIAANEFRYMLKSPQTVVSFLIFFLLAFFAMTSDNVQIGAGGNVNVNSPFAIAQTLLIMNIFAIFVIPAFLANAVLKDVEHKMDGILFTTPISKVDYLFGRFLGAFAALSLALMGAAVGMLMGTFWPGVDPESLMPTNLGHYLYLYGVFIVPSIFVFGSIIFAIAVISRSIMYTYMASLGFLLLYIVSGQVLSGPEYRDMMAMADPFMVRTFREFTRYWTAVDRNTLLIGYEGVILTNRLIWFAVSAGFMALAFGLFSFRQQVKLPKDKKNKKELAELARKDAIALGVKETPTFGFSTELQQFFLRVGFEVKSVVKSLPFMIIIIFSLILMISALLSRNVGYGLDAFPVTRLMIDRIQGGLGLGLIVVLIFYSADIIWRERTAKFHEIMDALPTPNWVYVGSKLIALAVVLVAILTIGVTVAIVIQMINGYDDFEIGLYLHRGVAEFVTPILMIAVLSVFVQVLSKNRFIGMMVMVVYIISTIILDQLGFEHPLYQYASGISAPLSDMNGSGRFLVANHWLNAYWAFFAIFLLMVSYLLWNRGTLQPIKLRLHQLRGLLHPVMAVVLVAFIGTGSFVYYNTNILNNYVTSDDLEQLAYDYEMAYRQYEDLPQPRVVAVKIDVDLFPHQQRVESRGTYRLKNKNEVSIDKVHVLIPSRDLKVPTLELEGATLESFDAKFQYYIFALETAMAPGEERTLTFETLIARKGFAHSRNSVSLVRNGTFINNRDITPAIGFSPNFMINDRNTRREYGLEPLPRMPKLEDASQYNTNYISQDSDFIDFETTVSTRAGQTAIAPGYLERTWQEGDRNYFHYKMDAPILHFYSYLSADYEVVREDWNDIAIEIFHHDGHEYNVQRMVESVKDSIAYFNKAFSPYQHRQVRILEFPAYRTFAQSFPNTIPYSEGIGFIADVTDSKDIDLPYYVTAHEVAHQWWAHQVMSANTQGSTMLVETLAQYGALLVMEQKYGKDQIRKFLKYELDRYLSGRGSDPEGELPLYRVENQQYIHYRKGAVIMYALKDYLGEDVVNRALQKLIAMRAYSSTPYAISTDLVTLLKAEAKPEQSGLIEDFLEKITLFDLRVDRATTTELPDGRFKVELSFKTEKFYADAEGNETAADFDIPVDIGLFTKSPAADGFTGANVILFEKRTLSNGTATLELIVEQKPSFVGIDPYNKLIDRNSNDNIKAVEAAEKTEKSSAP